MEEEMTNYTSEEIFDFQQKYKAEIRSKKIYYACFKILSFVMVIYTYISLQLWNFGYYDKADYYIYVGNLDEGFVMLLMTASYVAFSFNMEKIKCTVENIEHFLIGYYGENITIKKLKEKSAVNLRSDIIVSIIATIIFTCLFVETVKITSEGIVYKQFIIPKEISSDEINYIIPMDYSNEYVISLDLPPKEYFWHKYLDKISANGEYKPSTRDVNIKMRKNEHSDIIIEELMRFHENLIPSIFR